MRCYSALVGSVAAAFAALLLWACSGVDLMHVSEGYPFFHQLEIFGDRFTVVSPDSKTLRGLTFEGREMWRRSIVGDPLVARYDEGHLSVQELNTVLRLTAADGAPERLFDVPEHQRFVIDATYGLVYLTDQRFERNTFQLLDPDSRRPVWHREDIERLLHVEKDVLVVATARRDYDANRQSFSTRDLAVTGLDRRNGEVRWRVALGNTAGYVRSAVVSPCLVVIDEAAAGGLVCIDPASGRVLGKRAHSRLPEGLSIGLGYLDVAAQGNQVAFLESNIDGGDTFLRFASVPSFEVTQTLQLAGNERSLSLQGEHVFTKGLYRAICFDRRTGKERWQRTLVGEWKLLGDRVLLTDYDKRQKNARIVMVDLASGSERVIISEPASLAQQ
jgi:outer membrane protein assembly factor BamB